LAGIRVAQRWLTVRLGSICSSGNKTERSTKQYSEGVRRSTVQLIQGFANEQAAGVLNFGSASLPIFPSPLIPQPSVLDRVRRIDEAIEKANSVPDGLAAYAFTKSARNVDRFAEGSEFGNLSINHLVPSNVEQP
jgi:hypothetical protein